MELFNESDLADTFIPAIPAARRSPPSHIFTFPELQHLHVHVSLTPLFEDYPMKKMEIVCNNGNCLLLQAMGPQELSQHWQGIVFPHVEYLETDLEVNELDLLPIDFWREFLPNVKEVR